MKLFDALLFSFMRHWRYILVLLVFFLTIYYHYAIVPTEKIHKDLLSKEKTALSIQSDLNVQNREKIYENIFQSQKGDIFRVGMVVQAAQLQRIEVFLQSSLNERVSIGTLNIDPTENGQYKELVFSAPGYYSDVVLRLNESEEKNSKVWNNSNITLQHFFVTRVNIRSIWEIKSLLPTVFGLSYKKDVATAASHDGDLLQYARVEDLGGTLFYEFSLMGKRSDYTNIFTASKSVHFDKKKQLVVGSKKMDEFFIYKFDTLFPFDRFALKAEQTGKAPHELRLEYSLDESSWHPVASTQEEGKPEKFSVFIPGDLKSQVVYVRVSYNGEEKKTGTFSLQKLSVNAAMTKKINKR